MNAIEVKNLSKKFGKFAAVDNISFELTQNRVMGFLGPNGAGKTTTIRMLVGLSEPTAGTIKINEKDVIFGQSDVNKFYGYLPEQPAFYAWMTGEEYLNFVADTFSIKKDARKKKIAELLKKVDLTSARKKRIGAYSNGMKQRLGIAQALINDPKVLIMDEPVSALDPIGRKEILAIIEELKKDMTILLSTHILSDVDKICDDIAIIKDGRILTVSPIGDLKAKYAMQILEVEFTTDPEPLLAETIKQPWADKVEKSGNHLKIWLKDGDVISKNLPLKFFAENKIGILKYGLNLPEIEDLFVSILKENK